jgi:formaldehyde-activating enzyme
MSDARLPMIQGGEFEREDYEDMRTQLCNLGKITRVKKSVVGTRVDFMATAESPEEIENLTLCVGEGFAGPPFSEIAHIDLLLGRKDGPVGKAIKRALGEPRPGHEVVVINKRPQTLLVPTVTVRGEKARQLVYEEAAGGICMAIGHAIKEGMIPEVLCDDICMIANVFVHPAASIRQRVKINNYKAMRGAIRKAIEGRPTLEELIREKEAARHPFRYAP